MPTPFPGMDPYLERPALWPDVHNSLITALRDDLAPRLRPRYVVAVEERVYQRRPPALTFAGRPDLMAALNDLLHALYDRAGYDLRVDYRSAPEPPLDEEDAAWSLCPSKGSLLANRSKSG